MAVSIDWTRLLFIIPEEIDSICSLITLSRIRYVSIQSVPLIGT